MVQRLREDPARNYALLCRLERSVSLDNRAWQVGLWGLAVGSPKNFMVGSCRVAILAPAFDEHLDVLY